MQVTHQDKCLFSPNTSDFNHWIFFASAKSGWSAVITGVWPRFRCLVCCWISSIAWCIMAGVFANPSLTFLYKCHPTLYSAAQNCMKSWFQTVVIIGGGIWLSYCKNMKNNSKFCTHTKQIKGCVRYIFCYSFYFTKRKPLKMFFISCKKLFSFSRY